MMAARDVVLMTTHDIGRHLHCYGADSVESPHLDALAAEGVVFTSAFCTAPQCSPSRASLATGRYPHNNGVLGLAHHGFDWELAVPHAAATLASHGFETHLFGGQHVSLHPERLGFAHMHAPDHSRGNASGDSIAAGLEDLVRGAGEKRLYIEINFEETHRPYPVLTAEQLRDAHPEIPAYLPTGPEAAAELAALEFAVGQMDAAAGRVLQALDAAGRAENAIVVFTTDHGLAMPRAKCTLYDPGIEVSLIFHWPAGRLASRRPEALVSNIDVLPTLLEAAGVAIPAAVQGRSLLPLMRGETGEHRDAIFAEKTFHSYYDPMRCVRTNRHKYIRNFETAFAVEVPGDIQAGAIFRADPSRYSTDRPHVVELYDLESDPLELANLAGTPNLRELERELSEQLWAWMRETHDPLLDGPVASPRYRLAMES
jgi:arylsulfatase A-like enzyme